MGRATQGVRLINLKNNDEIAAVTKVSSDIIETEEEILEEESLNNEDSTNNEQVTEENISEENNSETEI